MSTNPEQRVLDDIDELVDWQLSKEPSGYDHNVNQPTCRCGEDWHALPITDRMRTMRRQYRWFGIVDDTYDHAADDSEILCPGSEVEGPLRPTGQRYWCGCPVCSTSAGAASPVIDRSTMETLSARLFEQLSQVLSLTTVHDPGSYPGGGGGNVGGQRFTWFVQDEPSVLLPDSWRIDSATVTVPGHGELPLPTSPPDELAGFRFGLLDPEGPVRTYRTIPTDPVATEALWPNLPVDMPAFTRSTVSADGTPMWVDDPAVSVRGRSIRSRTYRA